MNLPPPLNAFFSADRGRDVEPLLHTFAPAASVTDEGRTYEGRAAIGAWWREAKESYDHTAEPFAASQAGEVTRVTARVSGNFSGSPAKLVFAFTLADDLISRLEIGA